MKYKVQTKDIWKIAKNRKIHIGKRKVIMLSETSGTLLNGIEVSKFDNNIWIY